MKLDLKFEFINHHNPFLKEVIELGDSNSKTLGHLPEAVYEEYARKKWILIVRNGQKFLGHCLFRLTKKINVVKIAQLCISKDFRGQGIADEIISYLKEYFKNDFRGIGLNCRNDYLHANKLWRRNNFVPMKEKKGRAKKTSWLTYWFYNFNKRDLFSEINSERIKALIDINVIIKLRDINENEDKTIKALFSDSIISEIEYCYANETYHEIQRDSNQDRRKITRNLLNKFEVTKIEESLLNEVANDLTNYFNGNRINDESDRRQVSEAISAGIQYFITTDEGLLKKREKISMEYPIEILSPTEFLLQIDTIINEEKYIGDRLGGTQIEIRKAKSEELRIIETKFVKTSFKEKKGSLKTKIKDCCLNEESHIKVILNKNSLIGIWSRFKKNQQLLINILRIEESQLKPFLFKQLISESIRYSLNNQLEEINYLEEIVSQDEKVILNSFGFVKENNSWKKILIRDICSSTELFEKYPQCSSLLGTGKSNFSLDDKYRLERLFYPLKLIDLDIPNYIIPIKPFWASNLFDFHIASKDLFGAKPSLLWNRENVYYRSVRPNIEKYPARILWYVSSSPKEARSKGIVATSYLDDIHINIPKELFRRFKKYGVYNWNNIFDLAKNDIEKEIKVIEFSDTEVFNTILKLEDLKKILDKNITLQSPLKINNEDYLRIYQQFILI